MELNDRKKEILRAVIEAHIRDGEPVGSRALTSGKLPGGQTFALSSATIRNEMAELEQMGYLTHPHTSAGRVPSELGYRFYVDSLMQRYEMTQREIEEISRSLRAKTAELDAILKAAGKMASALTGYTSLSMKPSGVKQIVLRFSVTLLDEKSLLLVLVLSRTTAKTKILQLVNPLPPDAAERLEIVLNRFVAARDIASLTLPDLMEMENAMGEYRALVNPVMKQIYDTLSGEPEEGELQFSGMERLLQYQEFNDPQRLREVFGVFDNRPDKLIELIDQANSDGVSVYIGSENDLDAMHGSSLVFKKITAGGRVVGAIGVIGPCRMDYSKVISTIQYLSDNIAGMIGDSPLPTITQGGNHHDG